MRSLTLLAVFLLTTVSLTGQSKIITEQLESLKKPWTSLDVNDDNFQFVIVTDRTGGMRPGVFETGVDKINLIQPEFVMSVGDLINGYTRDEEKLEREWKEFNSFVDRFKMPFFYVAGNHDYTNEVMAEMWKDKFGSDRYHFLYKNVLFLCLNSEDGATALKNPDIGAEQLAYARQVLDKYPDVKWTMVFMHQPLWIRPSAKNWRALEETLEGRKHSVFTGHVHRFTLYERNRSDYFTLATMGGGSRLRGTRYGEFDHFMWVTMTDSGPYYANILLDGIHDKSIYTQDQLENRQQLEANTSIKLLPLFLEKGQAPKITFAVKNTEPEALTAKIAINNGDYLSTYQTSIEKEITPNSTTMIEVPVALTGEVNVHARPLSANVELGSNNSFSSSRFRVFPNQKYKLQSKSKKIRVDGNLSEWKKWQYSFGEEENQVHFSILESGKMLYVAAKINDADIQTNFGSDLMDKDGIIISIDPRPIAESAYNPRRQEDVMKGKWTAFIGQPAADEFAPSYAELLPEGVQGKGKRTASGYQVEFAVPISVLEKMRGGKLTDMRINVSVIDADKGEKTKEYSWLPEWNEMLLGSGTFFRR